MQGKSRKNLWFKRKYSEKAFVGTVCVDMGFFLWNGFSPGGILLCYHVEKEEIKLLIKKYNISQSFPHTKYEIFCANRVQRVTLWQGVLGEVRTAEQMRRLPEGQGCNPA